MIKSSLYPLRQPGARKYAFERYASFDAWRAAARPALAALLGLDRLDRLPRAPIVPKKLWTREFPLGTIEKIAFAPEPGVRTFAYLCLPNVQSPPYRTFICLQGHSTGMHNSIGVDFRDEFTPIPIEGDRDFAVGCLRRGIAAVCLEQRYMGENSTLPTREPDCYVPSCANLTVGRTTLGERVYDVDRLIDYLSARGEFDLARLGVTGNSGGGTTSMFAGALLDRITCVMPSCAFSSFEASICAMSHCVCNFVPGLLDYGESADVIGLAAPKPLVVVNGLNDEIFPIGAAREEFARVQAIYRAAGAPTRCAHVIGPDGHRYYEDAAWEAMSNYL